MKNFGRALANFLLLLLIVDLVILAVVAIAGLLLGWTVTEYSNALFIIGAVIIGLGVVRIHGLGSIERSYKVRIAQTTGSEGIMNAMRRITRESEQAFSGSARMFFIGLIPILISIFLPSIVGW